MRAHENNHAVELTDAALALIDRERQKKITELQAEVEKYQAMCPMRFLEEHGIMISTVGFELAGRMAREQFDSVRYSDCSRYGANAPEYSWSAWKGGRNGDNGTIKITPEQVKKTLCGPE